MIDFYMAAANENSIEYCEWYINSKKIADNRFFLTHHETEISIL